MTRTLSLSHDRMLMMLSVVMLLFASYVAIDIYARITRAAGMERNFWLAAGGIAIGGGVWSLHFTAMLSMDIGMPVSYRLDATLASFLIVFLSTLVGFHVACRENASLLRLVVAGFMLSAGSIGAHLIGLEAVAWDAEVARSWSVLSAAFVGMAAAITAALWLMAKKPVHWQKLVAAGVLALSICGMHYIDVLSLTYASAGAPNAQSGVVLSRGVLTFLIAFGAGALLAVVLVLAVFDRRMSQAEAGALRQSEELFRVMAEALPVSLAITRVEDREVIYSNRRSAELFQVPEDPSLRQPVSQRYVDPTDREKVAQAIA